MVTGAVDLVTDDMLTNRQDRQAGRHNPGVSRPAPLAAEFLADVKGLRGLGGNYPNGLGTARNEGVKKAACGAQAAFSLIFAKF